MVLPASTIWREYSTDLNPLTPQHQPYKSDIRAYFKDKEDRMAALESAVSINPKAYGFVGDGASHPLSGSFATLLDAQAVYPMATSLNDEFDLVSILSAVAALPAAGGEVVIPGQAIINRYLTLGTGSGSGPSAKTNIVLRGIGNASQANHVVPTSTAKSVIKMVAGSIQAAAVWVLGPVSVSIRDLTIDVNNLATRGLYTVHNIGFEYDNVTVDNYRDYAFDFAAYEDPVACGCYNTTQGVVKNCRAARPQLTTSTGAMIGNGSYAGLGVLDCARIIFDNCELTVGDSATAYGYLFRYCDNIIVRGGFIFSQTSACTPFQVAVPSGLTSYPQIITIENCVAYGVQTAWPGSAAWTPGDRGIMFHGCRWENLDRVGVPYDPYNRVKGWTFDGIFFGGYGGSAFRRANGGTLVQNSAAETVMTTVSFPIHTLGIDKTARIEALLYALNNTGSAQNVTIKAKATCSANAIAIGVTSYTLLAGSLLAKHTYALGSAGTITVPVGIAFGRKWTAWIENTSAFAVSLSPAATVLINGAAVAFSVAAGKAARIECTDGGLNWTITTVALSATLFDSGAVSLAASAGYRSLKLGVDLYALGTLVTQGAHGTLKYGAPSSEGGVGITAQSVTEVMANRTPVVTDGLDAIARYDLTITVTLGTASASLLCGPTRATLEFL